MPRKKTNTFLNGLATGLFLQLAIGPVFFFIINLTLQKTIYDGLAAVMAVTLVDYFYITLSVVGIGKLLERKDVKKIFGIISSLVLVAFGGIIIKSALENGVVDMTATNDMNIFSSFLSVFILTISSPMTIVFFTGIFSAKAIEYNYTKKQLYIFGLSVGLATLAFMGSSVLLFSLIKQGVPIILMQSLNILVGITLIGYGVIRFFKITLNKTK